MLLWNSKAKHPIEKIKAEKEKTKKRNKVGWNISVEMADGGEICGQPNLRLIYETLWAMTLYYTKYTISKFWISITVLKLLRALSKSSARSSDHLNSVFQPVPAAATCPLVLLAILFFIELFRIRILLFVVVFYQSTHALAHRWTGWMITWDELAGWFNRDGSLFKNEPARKDEPTRFQLTSCNSDAISTELTTDCRVDFKMM